MYIDDTGSDPHAARIHHHHISGVQAGADGDNFALGHDDIGVVDPLASARQDRGALQNRRARWQCCIAACERFTGVCVGVLLAGGQQQQGGQGQYQVAQIFHDCSGVFWIDVIVVPDGGA